MQEKRGNKLYKQLDRWLGSALIFVLNIGLKLKRLFNHKTRTSNGFILVVCFGAIGDLILLSEAVRANPSVRKMVYLACSKLNYEAAKCYNNLYADVAVVDLKNPFSLYKITQRYDVSTIFDSTQWANIGPMQVAFAELLAANVETIGFATESVIRNGAYCKVIPHLRGVHEVLNFTNLLLGKCVFNSNAEIPKLIPRFYQIRPMRTTHKVVFHMWPSGNRSYLKAWPEIYWQELVKYFVALGNLVYLSGAPGDHEQTKQFIKKLGADNAVNIAGRYSLSELSRFIENEIELVVSVNTGILHLAASTGVPVIGLHGPTNPVRWGPLGANSLALLPERGNFAYLNYGFEYPADDAEAYAMEYLTVQQVTSAFEQLKQKRS